MRKLATIQMIRSLSPIPNADAIEKAEVLGWEVVVKKNDFRVGDRVVFCELDSILPELPVFEFLRPKKFRIKTCKLRGCISQGIVFPLSIINEIDPTFDVSRIKIDDDITDVLRITKYDPEVELDVEREQIKKSWLERKISYLKWKLFGIKPAQKGSFPTHLVPKTDEIRVQKMGSELSKREGQLAYITSKLEGTSATFIYRKTDNWLVKIFNGNCKFQICSRNMVVFDSQTDKTVDHHLFQVSEKLDLFSKLKKLNRNLAVQGECIGPKIQKNIYNLPELDFRVFLIYDLDDEKYLPFQEAFDLTQNIGLQFVPILEVNVPIINDVKYYVELSKGFSKICPSVKREGIVVRTMSGDFSFKSINPDFLLEQK